MNLVEEIKKEWANYACQTLVEGMLEFDGNLTQLTPAQRDQISIKRPGLAKAISPNIFERIVDGKWIIPLCPQGKESEEGLESQKQNLKEIIRQRNKLSEKYGKDFVAGLKISIDRYLEMKEKWKENIGDEQEDHKEILKKFNVNLEEGEENLSESFLESLGRFYFSEEEDPKKEETKLVSKPKNDYIVEVAKKKKYTQREIDLVSSWGYEFNMEDDEYEIVKERVFTHEETIERKKEDQERVDFMKEIIKAEEEMNE